MVLGVVDIGTNTTRLLVAEVEAEKLRPLLQRRHFIAPREAAIDEVARLVEREANAARAAGAEELIAVGTAAIRRLPEARRLARLCERLGIGGLRVLSEADEARFAFLGATRSEPGELPDAVAVADVGGGSTELVVGSPREGPGWWASRPLGSRALTERALHSDPPTGEQLAAARNAAARRLARVEPPPCELALAVGGCAASLGRLSGGSLDRGSIGELFELLLEDDSVTVGNRLGIAPQRVRLLPAALAVYEAICELVPEPLRIARGGIREGLLLDRAHERAAL